MGEETMMSRRSIGFVGRYLTVPVAASYFERDRREMWERVQVGALPAMRSAAGEWIIPAGALGSINRRVSEHDL
jgi:hypothetical protein